ncbi:NAD-dependent epimerase/dehydratase family protein [Clostridium paridis]|uniref:NAD(P)-dependent oxidoreductase n=1 Tax=Clostridium paridis TaxID=2803863 RepID=A0A937FJM0_9CLOT|nr:NAD(P)-dependent oxidoreductase [Clostridium paridis]MBL4933543.1 NAD(P)-dependent oxidoreductase [Clostridium paridis]
MKQVLLTGSNGFIGRRLKEKLIELKYEVLELNSSNGDVTSIETLRTFNLEKIGHIFHLAAKTFVPESWMQPEEFYKVNTFGTLNILEICKEYNIDLTFISSYIYGQPKTMPISESSDICPNNPYAHSKYIAEQMCEFYSREFNVNVSIIRPFNIYGIGQNKKFLIPHIIDQALYSNEIKIKDLSPKRDYIYLEDVVDAILLTINNNKNYSVYNIGSGYSISVQQVIEVVLGILNIEKKVISEDSQRKNEMNDVVADITKANRELNWYPKYSFLDGIKKIIDREISN